LADLVPVDVEGGHELDVANVVAAQVDVHQPWNEVALGGVLVVVAALDEAARTVAHAHDRDADLAFLAGGPCAVAGGPVAARVLRHGCQCAPSLSCRRTWTMRWMTVIAKVRARTASAVASGKNAAVAPMAMPP